MKKSLLLHCILCTFICSISLPLQAEESSNKQAPTPASITTPVDKTTQIMQDLKQALPATEYKQLSSNTTLLWRQYSNALPKGVAILIPDWGLSPTTPKQINQLRIDLTRIGFNTYALLPPAPQLPTTTPNTSAKNDTTQTQSVPYQQTLLKQLQEIENEIAATPGFKLVVAQGANVAWLAQLYQQQDLTEPDALVILNAYFPESSANANIASQLAKLMAPLLEINSLYKNRWQQQTIEQRQIEMQRQIKLNYRQHQLELENDKMLLFKTIYGWLTSLGWY